MLLIVLLGIAASVYYFRYYKKQGELFYWRTSVAEKGDVSVFVTATGSLAADTSVDIGVQVSGTIADLKADFNDKVRKGQIIAILDTTFYYAAKVDAEAALQRTQVSVDETKREYDRASVLIAKKDIAQLEYDQAYAAYLTAQSNLVSAQAQLSRALINLQYCTVRAPISGMVIARNVQVGNMVIASFNSPVLFTIAADLRKMQVQANVDEADIGQVSVGQEARFTVDAYPNDVFSGVVEQIRHQPVILQNVVNYVVIIKVSNPELKLMPGLTANANIFIRESKDVLRIPTNAFSFNPPAEYLQATKLLSDSVKEQWLDKLKQNQQKRKHQIKENDNSAAYVWVKKGNDIYPVFVHKGLNDGTFTEVSGDIKEGDVVVTGTNHAPSASDTQSTQNPFMPKFPSRKK